MAAVNAWSARPPAVLGANTAKVGAAPLKTASAAVAVAAAPAAINKAPPASDASSTISSTSRDSNSNAHSQTQSKARVSAAAAVQANDVKHLIVDSGALIGYGRLESFGPLVKYWTIPEVLAEIKDEQTRQKIRSFPYKLELRPVSEAAMKFVTGFAKQTGDLYTLSATDLKVLALTYMLENETNGTKNIRSTPLVSSADVAHRASSSTPSAVDAPRETSYRFAAAFQVRPFSIDRLLFLPSHILEAEVGTQLPLNSVPELLTSKRLSMAAAEEEGDDDDGKFEDDEGDMQDAGDAEYTEANRPSLYDQHVAARRGSADSSSSWRRQDNENTPRTSTQTHAPHNTTETKRVETRIRSDSVASSNASSQQGRQLDSASRRSDVTRDSKRNDDGDGEWITVENLSKHRARATTSSAAPARSSVACMTADFAMQNVMLQMGLRLISVDGLAISSVRQWVLRCHACFAVSRDMSRQFCPNCGNHSMIKQSVLVSASGRVSYRGGEKKIMNNRGTKYSIPKPKGGRNNTDVILREDELEVVNRRFKGTAKPQRLEDIDPFRDAIEFGYTKAGPDSRNRTFGFGKRNPNEAQKLHTGRRKGGAGRR